MEWQDLILLSVCSLGFMKVLKVIVSLYKSFHPHLVIRKPLKLKNYGSWAVITGCTDGIGRAIAFDLASAGLNLVLIARNASKLGATADEIIGEKYGIKVKSIVIDLAKVRGPEIARKIEQGIEGLDVGVLVNNAGLANPGGIPMYLHEHDMELVEGILRVNAEAAAWVIRAVLPGMMKKKRGAIVNMGSSSTYFVPAFPLGSIYAGTKEYLSMLSRSLSLEYEKYGIDIQCQIIAMVETKMVPFDRSFSNSFFMAPPKVFSKASINWIGRSHLCVPYWRHQLLWSLGDLLPKPVLGWVMFQHFLERREKKLFKNSNKLVGCLRNGVDDQQ